MIRRAFLKRMGLAFVASAFVDVETLLPVQDEAGAVVGALKHEIGVGDLSDLVRQVFTDSVLPHVRMSSPLAAIAADHAARDLQRERTW